MRLELDGLPSLRPIHGERNLVTSNGVFWHLAKNPYEKRKARKAIVLQRKSAPTLTSLTSAATTTLNLLALNAFSPPVAKKLAAFCLATGGRSAWPTASAFARNNGAHAFPKSESTIRLPAPFPLCQLPPCPSYDMTTPSTETSITPDDLPLLLAEVGRFCRQSLRPLVERPFSNPTEQTLSGEDFTTLTAEAAKFGLLGDLDQDEESAAGLWASTEGSGLSFSLRALQRIAEDNAGVAFHFHQLALGDWLRRRLQMDVQGGGSPTIACLQGTLGLARHSLPRLLRGRPLGEDDVAMLRDYFVGFDHEAEGDSRPLLFQAADDWQQLLVPQFSESQSLRFSLFERADLKLADGADSGFTRLEQSHGLDETSTWQWLPDDTQPRQTFDNHDLNTAAYTEALRLNALALVAIGLGAFQRGYAKAKDYAAIRVQGGKTIDQHAAVQKMLANGSSTIRTIELMLQGLCQSTDSNTNHAGDRHDSLAAAFSVRAQAHDMLCTAANDQLQVFGGLGYVQETGLEKIARDNNHLRQLCGTPSELQLFLAEWEQEKTTA